MNDNAAAADREWISQVKIVRDSYPVVIDDNSVLSDLDSELVDSSSAVDVSIVCGENKLVPRNAIDCAGPPVLGSEARDHQRSEVVFGAMEVEAPGVELELRLSIWSIGTSLILRDKTEVCFTS